MTQQLHRPPEKAWSLVQLPTAQALYFSGQHAWPLLLPVTVLLVVFVVLVTRALPQMQPYIGASPLRAAPLQGSNGTTLEAMQLSTDQALVYEQQNRLYRVPVRGGTPQLLVTPGYSYNRSVAPLLTPSGQLIYSGDGVWMTDIFSGQPRQIATLPVDQVVTSLVLSQDATMLAWSSAPKNGIGSTMLYAGPLAATTSVYQQIATHCPCFRVFAFLSGSNSTLLLTDDHGDHDEVEDGLWQVDLLQGGMEQPRQMLASDPPQGPLALAPNDDILLYTSAETYAPLPMNNRTPQDIATQSYANDLLAASVGHHLSQLGEPQVIVLPQALESDNPAYRWLMTPTFAPDGQSIAYISFASNVTKWPFVRHYTLYTVSLHASHEQFTLDIPHLLGSMTDGYIELGSWLNEHILTFYAEDALYAIDIQKGALAKIAQTGAYAHIIAVSEWGHV